MDSGNTAWILTSTALVLFMTMPGLALFYGGLVRVSKYSIGINAMLCDCLLSFFCMVVYGIQHSFFRGSPYFGDLSQMFLMNMARDSLSGDIPESAFLCFK